MYLNFIQRIRKIYIILYTKTSRTYTVYLENRSRTHGCYTYLRRFSEGSKFQFVSCQLNRR